MAGNPVAVVHDADDLSTDRMQAITRWFNLSETTFLCAPTHPGADYRVRIFTLASELPFAGHPTLGTCHAWLAAGGSPGSPAAVVQECGAGDVRIRSGDRLAFAAPPLVRSGPVDPTLAADVRAVLGVDEATVVDMAWVDNGPGWIGVLLPDRDTVLSLEPDVARSTSGHQMEIGVVAPIHGHGGHDVDDPEFEIRAFFTGLGGQLLEDPVTGSLNASLAQWLTGSGRAPSSYVAAQGTAIGRSGRIHIDVVGDDVWVGGATVTVVSGEIDLGS